MLKVVAVYRHVYVEGKSVVWEELNSVESNHSPQTEKPLLDPVWEELNSVER